MGAVTLGRAAALLAAITMAGCLSSPTTVCDSGRICPSGNVCDELHDRCVFPDQLLSCVGAGDGDSCAAPGAEAGVCVDEVCLPAGCGDGLVTGAELCDGDNLAGKSDCTEIGFYDPGPIGCLDDCTFDTVDCGRKCNDGVVDPEEDCDGADLGEAVECRSLGFYDPGTLSCTTFCTYDVTRCTGSCGDDLVNGPELCDGAPPDDVCVDYGFDAGRLDCQVCGIGFGRCGTIGWRSISTGLDGSVLAIHGTGPDDVYVSTYAGAVRHWNGSTWSSAHVGSASSAYASDVWAIAPGLAYAVTRNNSTQVGEVVRYDGTSWQLVDVGLSPGGEGLEPYLQAVWASGPSDVYVGGNQDLLRYDGQTWSREIVEPAIPTGAFYVSSIWGSGADDVYVVQNGALWHRAGTWSRVALPLANGVAWVPHQVGGSGPDAVVVGGRRSDGVLTFAHWNGVRWTVILTAFTMPGTDRLDDLWASSARDIYAVGASMDILRFDGIEWTEIGPPGVRSQTVWADGEIMVGGGTGALLRSRGAMWRSASLGGGQGHDVWGFDASQAYVASDLGVLRWTGYLWTTMLGSSSQRVGVWGTGPSDLYAVANQPNNNLFRYPGTTWAQSGSVADSMTQVYGSAANDVWAVGEDGAIAHWNGAAWTSVASGTGQDLWDIWGSGPDDYVAVGNGGTILHYDGAAWSPMTSGTTEHLFGVWGATEDQVFAVGAAGTVLRWDGSTWTSIPTGVSDRLFVVGGTAADDVFAGGTDGGQLFLHWDGVAWAPIRPPSDGVILGIWGVPGRVFFVDSGGIAHQLIRTRPWSCRSVETACGDGVDDDCDGLLDDADTADCRQTLLLHEVHGGAPDYVEVIARGTADMNLYGVTMSYRFANDDGKVHSYRFPGDAIARPGEVFRATGTALGLTTRERAVGAAAIDEPGLGGWVALCAGPCDLDGCSNLLDYVEKAGPGSPPPQPPACATFLPAPIDVGALPAAGASTLSPTRSAFVGGGATGLAADWSIAAATRE